MPSCSAIWASLPRTRSYPERLLTNFLNVKCKDFLPWKQVSEKTHSGKNEGCLDTEKRTSFLFSTDYHSLIRTSEAREFAHFAENVQPFSVTTDLFVIFSSSFRLKKRLRRKISSLVIFQSVRLKKVRRLRTLRPKASDSLSEGFGRKFRWTVFFCGAWFFLQEGSPSMHRSLKWLSISKIANTPHFCEIFGQMCIRWIPIDSRCPNFLLL